MKQRELQPYLYDLKNLLNVENIYFLLVIKFESYQDKYIYIYIHMYIYIYIYIKTNANFNPIQDRARGGGQKGPPTSFSPVTSSNVGFGPQNFLTFSFNPFGTLVQIFKFAPSASHKSLNLNQDYPSKKAIFLVKSLKN